MGKGRRNSIPRPSTPGNEQRLLGAVEHVMQFDYSGSNLTREVAAFRKFQELFPLFKPKVSCSKFKELATIVETHQQQRASSSSASDEIGNDAMLLTDGSADESDSEEDQEEPGVKYMELEDTNLANKRILARYNRIKQPSPSTSAGSPSSESSLPAAKKQKLDSNNKAKQTAPPPTPLSLKRPHYSKEQEKEGSTPSTKLPANAIVKKNVPDIKLSDLGGIDPIVQEIRELIEYPLIHPEIFVELGVKPVTGILLHGPPGCGKTTLANAIAGELGVSFFKISAPDIISGLSGGSEAKLRNLFKDARSNAPSLIFIDEIDTIMQRRDWSTRQMEQRIVSQLLVSMNELNSEALPSMSDQSSSDFSGAIPPDAEIGEDGEVVPQTPTKTAQTPSDDVGRKLSNGKFVIVIGATSRIEAIDPSFRIAGRFDREIAMGIPDVNAREQILRVLTSKLKLEIDRDPDGTIKHIDLRKLAKHTPGFVGADLHALTKEAASVAVNRIFRSLFVARTLATTTAPQHPGQPQKHCDLEMRKMIGDTLKNTAPISKDQLSQIAIRFEDFEKALPRVQPSAKREGFATAPDATWDDVGALEDVRAVLHDEIIQHIRYPEKFAQYNITSPVGVLLYGPPGCGKTLLAKAIANESGCNFISINGPELLNKYVGESERHVRQVFERGAASAPCVIFFDELDALCPKRGGEGISQSSERVVNQLLTAMQGFRERKDVFVIGATNRPDMIDPAMLRPGRLGKLLFVPLPNEQGRVSILKAQTRNSPLAQDVNLALFASDKKTRNYSGADLAALIREASLIAVKEDLASNTPDRTPLILARHIAEALTKVRPSVTEQQALEYITLAEQIKQQAASS